MRVPLDRLIDGVVHTLTQTVAPAVEDRFARGQLWAVIDVLNNLRDRIEEKATLLSAEAESAEQALAAVVAGLRAAGAGEVAERLAARGRATGADTPAARAQEARAGLVTAIDTLATLPAGVGDAARRAIGTHLASQALRDLQVFKVSLLQEISKG